MILLRLNNLSSFSSDRDIAGCFGDTSLCLVRMIHALLVGGGRDAARAVANDLVAAHPSFRFAPFHSPSTAYIVDTMQTVLHFYFVTNSFEECVVETVNQSGDADTTGALAAMLAGATYGSSLPSRWLTRLDSGVVAEVRRQSTRLASLA